MATEAPSPSLPPSVPVGAIVVLVLAALAYLAMVACLNDFHHPGQDAAGRGLSAAFAMLFGIVVWFWLAILLVIGGVKGSMPFWAGIAVAILLPVSAVTSAIALDLIEREGGWLVDVPIALPPMFAAYGLWARLTGLHAALPETVTSVVAVAALVALTLAPMPEFLARESARAAYFAEQRRQELAEKAEADKRHAEALARFQKLTPDSPLSDWAAYFGKDSEFDKEAIEGARKLTHRQTDAEDALRRGLAFPLAEYYRLDLKATPEFCTAARDFLIQAAATHRASPDKPDDESAEDYFEPLLGGIEWLTQVNCDLTAAVTALDEAFAAPGRPAEWFRGMLAWRRGNGFMKRDANDEALENYSTAIRLMPGSPQFYHDRGYIYFQKREYPQAIADFTEAIRFNEGYWTAYTRRGLAYHESGDDVRAMEDYNKALELDDQYPSAHFYRGVVISADGDQARAIEDFDAAIRLFPNYAGAMAARGRARFFRSEYPLAVTDLTASLALTPHEPYTLLWLYLARARAGQDAGTPFTKEAAQIDRAEWPWPIIAAYLGETDAAAVLSASQADKDHACEADFYFGLKSALAGDPAAARPLLQQATEICPSWFIETSAAKFELAKLP